jgi:hypothetical protein
MERPALAMSVSHLERRAVLGPRARIYEPAPLVADRQVMTAASRIRAWGADDITVVFDGPVSMKAGALVILRIYLVPSLSVVAILAYVDVKHPVKTLGPQHVLQSAERLVSRSSGPKAV